jgi:FeS assembly SUF system protein
MPERAETIETPASAPPPTPLNTIERSLYAHEVAEQIRTVYDPEIPVNVYDLGLIYDIQVDDARNVNIVMTLTSPACPVAGELPEDVAVAARQTPGIGKVTVELTWDPPFTIERIPEEIRLMLGLD